MAKYVGPVLGVIVGLIMSVLLQNGGVQPLVAKMIGVVVAILVFVGYGRWKAGRP